MMKLLKSRTEPYIPFAPPFLKDGDLIVSHVANILFYLGPKLGLAPKNEAFALYRQWPAIDHHRLCCRGARHASSDLPTNLYYEDQKEAAKQRSADFIEHRIPKFMGYFERVLEQNPEGNKHAVGANSAMSDLSLFQIVEGLRYAFPRATKEFGKHYPALIALHDAIEQRPNIEKYLASERRLDFNESGIFRHYPELDQDA